MVESRDPLYDGTTHLATVTAYRLDGEVASVTDPAGHTTTYDTLRAGDDGWDDVVDAPEEALEVTEVSVTTDPEGVSALSFTDRSGDVVLTKTGTLGGAEPLAVTTNVYEELGRLRSSTGPDGVTTWYAYDEEGRTVGVTTGPDPDDPERTVTTVYDGWGNVESTITPFGEDPDEEAVTSTTRFFTDAAGRTFAQIEGYGGPSGDQLMTGFVFDAAGRSWRTIVHLDGDVDPEDALVAAPGDRVTETRYTPAGRTAQQLGPPDDVTVFDWDEEDDEAKSITSYAYDTAGRQTMVTGPDGLDTTTTYDALGRTQTVTTPGGHVTTYDYDPAGRVVAEITPSGLTGVGDPEWVQVDRAYTPTGLLATETDPYAPGVDTPVTRGFVYDLAGRLVEVTDANGDVVSYDFDERGNRVARHSVDEDDDPIIETWDHDLADRVTTHRRPYAAGGSPGPATTYGYDPDFGWLSTVTDPTGRVETRDHYSDGTLRAQTHTGPSLDTIVVERWVDVRGRQVGRRDTKGAAPATTTTWAYTRDGRQAEATHPGSRTVGYVWNLDGTLAALTHADGAQRRYGYDTMGRVTSIAVAPTPTGTGVPFASLTYDDDGRQLGEVVHAAGGSARLRLYDDAGRLTNFLQYWDDDDSGWDVTGEIIGYRSDGRIVSRDRTPGGVESYDYDPAGQLTSVTGGTSPVEVVYGPRGNRVAAESGSGELVYGYNANGSIDTIVYDDVGITASFVYDVAGRRTGIDLVDGDDDPIGSITQSHDAAGRAVTVTRDFEVTTVTSRSWDGDGNLDALYHHDGSAWWAAQYLWDTAAGGLPRLVDSYLFGVLHGRHDVTNQYLAVELATGGGPVLQWYGYDALGSVVDPNDNPLLLDGPDTYDPWGTPTPGPDAHPQGIYRGSHRWGDLIHLWARDYHPETGQFTAPDPLDGVDGTPTVANPYHYTDNDPLNKTDPTGMRPEDGNIDGPSVDGAYAIPPVIAPPHIVVPALIAVGIPVLVWNILQYTQVENDINGGEYLQGESEKFLALSSVAQRRKMRHQVVYRVYGGCSLPFGASWTPIDPRAFQFGATYRYFAGLPTCNTMEELIQAKVIDPTIIVEARLARSIKAGTRIGGIAQSHDVAGGLLEYIIPEADRRVREGRLVVLAVYAIKGDW